MTHGYPPSVLNPFLARSRLYAVRRCCADMFAASYRRMELFRTIPSTISAQTSPIRAFLSCEASSNTIDENVPASGRYLRAKITGTSSNVTLVNAVQNPARSGVPHRSIKAARFYRNPDNRYTPTKKNGAAKAAPFKIIHE